MIPSTSILGLVEEMHHARDLPEFYRLSMRAAQELFTGSVVTFHHNTYTPEGSSSFHICDDPRANAAVANAWRRHNVTSPIAQYYLRGGTDPVIGTQDLISDVRLRQSELYAECWRPFGVNHQIGIRVWDRSWLAGLSIKRDTQFTDTEKRFASTLYPHFVRAWKRVMLLETIRDKRLVLIVDADSGSVATSEFLRVTLELADVAELESRILRSVKTSEKTPAEIVLDSGKRFRVFVNRWGDLTRWTLFKAARTSSERLTDREREVLRWISQGKRDAEIATILGTARRTVSKHVENILSKMSVENRTAAARMAFGRPARRNFGRSTPSFGE